MQRYAALLRVRGKKTVSEESEHPEGIVHNPIVSGSKDIIFSKA
jgi:hypothetical protein